MHLHTHSEYSLLDGLSRIGDLVARAGELGMPALALTDHGSLYGAIDLYTRATAAGIKPIIGVETYVARGSRFDRDAKIEGHGRPFHLVLLAKDFEGYQALVRMVTEAHLNGYYYRPRIDRELIRANAGHIVALSACLQGEVSRALLEDGIDAACKAANEHRELFGEGNYFLELMDHGIPEQKQVLPGLREVAKRTGIPLAVTNDLHYVHAEDAEAQDVMVCIQSGKTIDTPDRLRMIDHPEIWMKSGDDMAALFPADGDALDNTLRIAEMVDIKLPMGQLRLPAFTVTEGRTPDEQLRAMAEAGVRAKYPEVTPEIRARMERELDVIAKTGYAGYILIVQDFIRFARERGILTAVRGSAGGSLVNYAIDLTDIDPLKYDLMFDRFLNLERYTQPDIDVDFMDNRRDEVIAYVSEKYGTDRVAQIGTFNTMLARAAVRDVARVLGMPYGEADRVAKAIPFGTALADAREMVAEIKQLEADPNVARLLDLAEKVEGLVRSTGTHAAGVLITRDPLIDLVPLERSKGKTDSIQTQFEDKQLEALGLLKFDFLGLGNLTILDRAMALIKEKRGIELRREDLPLDDAKTFELLASGETTGLFQLESAGMRRYVKDLRPDRVEDVMAMVALFRPGPMDWITSYIRRKRGQEPITYDHPLLEPVLKETYGVMVYQEDVMAVTQALAGFTLAEADVLCYTIRKKIREKLDAQKTKFMAGAHKNGISMDVVERVWANFEPFARYGFNRAHAAIYGIIAYHTAYLKANYTAEYMTAVLSTEMGTPDRIAIAIAECRRMGIEVLPPDINASDLGFAVDGNTIRFGLGAVKNVGEGAVEAIIEARGDTPFRSLEDLCQRVDLQRLNKRVLESLVKCGACDAFGTRQAQIDQLDAVLATAQREQKDRNSGQISLFGEVLAVATSGAGRIEGPEAPRRELLGWEKELLGIYLSEHPLQELTAKLGDVVTAYLAELREAGDEMVIVGCVVTSARKHVTKKNELMLFAQIEDLTGTSELTVFPRTYRETAEVWSADEILLVLAKVEQRDDAPQLLCEYAVRFDDGGIEQIKQKLEERRGFAVRRQKYAGNGRGPANGNAGPPNGGGFRPREAADQGVPAGPAPQILVRFRSALDYDRSVALFQRIQGVLGSHPGSSPVALELPRADGNTRRIPTALRAQASPALSAAIEREVGDLVEVLVG